jgi:sugar diacid utilization regulator
MTLLHDTPVLDDSCAPHRAALSRLRSLLVLAQLMMESTSQQQIVALAGGAARSLAPGTPVRIEVPSPGLPAPGGASPDWVVPIRCGRHIAGHLIAAGGQQLGEDEHFLLRALAQHTGAALANRRLHDKEQQAVADAERVSARLQQALGDLQASMAVHERLTRVALAGEGSTGIAKAVHDLTGLPTAVEDRFGNLWAWEGDDDRPHPYPKQPAAEREVLLRRVVAAGGPVRVGERWLGVAHPQPDVLGVVALVDPQNRASPQDLTALEHGVTVLAIELARLRSLAESELRVRRDLVEDLLAGVDEESVLRRAHALKYDLGRPHWVVVVEGATADDEGDVFLHTVRRTARDMGAGTLLARRGSSVVLLADRAVDWGRFRDTVRAVIGGGSCRVGVGPRCTGVGQIPDSHRQAEIALRLQRTSGWPEQALSYDDLGVFQLLSDVRDPDATRRFIVRWLAPLLDYDEHRHADLVLTLAQFLDCGGNYDHTSAALVIHRSTLKYRLGRIREITGYDLNDPDTRFNLQLSCRAWRTVSALGGPHADASSRRD